MKISKNKSKGKVHPSPITTTTTNPSSFLTCKDASSTLKLLPVTILTLISVLSPSERQVFAYMITRSIKATSNPSSLLEDSLIRTKKSTFRNSGQSQPQQPHVSPVFDCGCFECYTSYWFQWDSSPNRELIHQAIEAFEEAEILSNTASGDQQKKKSTSSVAAASASGGRGKSRKERVGCRLGRQNMSLSCTIAEAEVVNSGEMSTVREAATAAGKVEYAVVEKGLVIGEGNGGEDNSRVVVKEDKVDTTGPELKVDTTGPELKEGEVKEETEIVAAAGKTPAAGGGGGGNHKGLARKVLPDVIGLFNSRMWSLWSPNV